MAKRNVWTYSETKVLLDVINDKQCVALFDSKKYRNSEIYKIIANEMKCRGFIKKDAKQIEVKWKNLKSNFMACKKQNGKSGSGRTDCDFREELQKVFGIRPSCRMTSVGKDSHDDGAGPSSQLEVDIIEIDAENETIHKTPRKRRSSTDLIIAKLTKMQKALNDDVFHQQKELIEYESTLFEATVERNESNFQKILEENTKQLLQGLKNLVGSSCPTTLPVSSSNRSLQEFYSWWNEELEDSS